MFISFYPCLEKIDNANRVLFSFVLVQESPGIALLSSLNSWRRIRCPWRDNRVIAGRAIGRERAGS